MSEPKFIPCPYRAGRYVRNIEPMKRGEEPDH